MTIPEIRAELKAIIRRLVVLTAELQRRSPVSRAPPTSQPMTRALAIQIQVYKAAHPKMSNKAIGQVFNVDGGRVSEAIRGKRV